MKINLIGGVSLEEYNRCNVAFEEIKIAVENYIPISNQTLIDLGMEESSLIGDVIKGTWRGTKGAVKMGVQGVKAANKGYANVKNKWADIRPKLIKLIKDFGISLQSLWSKFMKYDVKYIELGKKINNIINFSVNQMQSMPNVTLYWHQFDSELLNKLLQMIIGFDKFWKFVIEPSTGFFRNFPEPQKMATAIKNGDLNTIQTYMEDFSAGIGKLNEFGDLTIATKMDAKMKLGLFSELDPETKRKAKEGSIALAEFVKVAILRNEVTKKYDDSNKEEFKKDMTGSEDAFLVQLGNILNNNILTDALKQGGTNVKKITDSMIKYLDSVMKQAEVVDKLNQDKTEQANKKQAEIDRNTQNKSTRQNQSNTNGAVEPEFAQFGDNTNNATQNAENAQAIDNSLSSLVEMYTQNYMLLFTKLGNTYGNIVRGVLAATYEIVSEAEGIVSVIESSANKIK